jgi:glycosyltransferase involved in cell wall biosynthesis
LDLNKLFNNAFKYKTILFDYISREDTVAAYKASNLFLFPSNIECSPIVLFECAAASLPFLSTDVGNSIEIAAWTKGGKILPTTKDGKGNSYANIDKSAQILNEIYANKIELEQMAKNSHDIWLKKYTWEAITKQYELLYLDLLKK